MSVVLVGKRLGSACSTSGEYSRLGVEERWSVFPGWCVLSVSRDVNGVCGEDPANA